MSDAPGAFRHDTLGAGLSKPMRSRHGDGCVRPELHPSRGALRRNQRTLKNILHVPLWPETVDECADLATAGVYSVWALLLLPPLTGWCGLMSLLYPSLRPWAL